MSSTVSSRPSPRSPLLSALLKPGNVLPALVWLFFVFGQAINSPLPPSLTTVLLVLINSVAVVLFVVRRDATRVGTKLETLVALAGTFIVAFLKGPRAEDIHWLPTVIQVVALLGWASSLLTLGRSFGLVPADRGLVDRGPYRHVRHPVYAFEALFFIGYLIAAPSLWNGIIAALWSAFQVTRILREESILESYEEYKRRVPWRLIPGIW